MNNTTRSLRASPAPQRRVRWRIFDWTAVGIRTKIVVPLIVLMLLSILGSTIGFLISTTATREHILTRQLDDETRRLVAALQQSEQDALEATHLLTQDTLLIRALLRERRHTGTNTSLAMVDRAVPIRDRFGLDQIIILDTSQQARVNIAPSHLEPISVNGRELLPLCRDVERHLARFEEARLLIICAPVYAPSGALIADVYTVLDLAPLLNRIHRNLELTADVSLVAEIAQENALAAQALDGNLSAGVDMESTQRREVMVLLGDGQVPIALQLTEQGADEIVNSGLRVTLISSGITLLVLLLAGAWLAQSFTRPILKVARVAQAVAAGDLSQRANLTHRDEIGLLGCSLDRATGTIATLLEQQAHAAGERQAILESIADGVLAVDMDERIVVMNPAAAALLQQNAEAMLGHPLSALSLADDPVFVVGLQQLVHQLRGELVDTDHALTEKQVSLGEHVVLLQSAPTLGSGGIQTGAVMVLQDITRMVEADQSKSAFIATASHELRTPLTSLKGFVDILSRSRTDNLDEMQQMCIDTIKRQTDSMIMLVNDLLEMARLEQGAQRMECRWVAPGDALEEALISVTGLIEKRQVTLELLIAPDLPPVWIDVLHLRRILTNVMSNAIKYVYPGGKVWIRAYQLDDPALLPSSSHEQPWNHSDERSLVIEIEDDGVGIRESDHPKVFTRFFRSDNPLSIEVGGTGLGLAITRSLIELHEGQIGFRSVEGAGSCFWIRLPAPNAEPLIQTEAPDYIEMSVGRQR